MRFCNSVSQSQVDDDTTATKGEVALLKTWNWKVHLRRLEMFIPEKEARIQHCPQPPQLAHSHAETHSSML